MIGGGALQDPGLLGGRFLGRAHWGSCLRDGEQCRALEQTAEIFFARDVPCARLCGEGGVGFIFHFQAFEADDAYEFAFFFPDLALAEFHAEKMECGGRGGGFCPS